MKWGQDLAFLRRVRNKARKKALKTTTTTTKNKKTKKHAHEGAKEGKGINL